MKKMMKHTRIIILMLGALVLFALLAPALAAAAEQLGGQPQQSPNMPDDKRPFFGIPWIIGAILTLAVVAVGLKNSKRSHLD
jgi:hypothetical protein